MNLSNYVSQVCDALNATPTDKDGKSCNITITLNPEHMGYRTAIAEVLRNAFCGAGAYASDMLFNRAQQVTNDYQNSLRRQAQWAFDKEEAKKEKPKRGRIPKAKIEKAVKEVKDAAKEG